jgi:hypothetical protein
MKKVFCCPVCNKHFSIWKLFTLKNTLTCSNCKREFGVKKQIISFNQGFAASFIPVSLLGFGMKFMEYPFKDAMIACSLLGITILLIGCTIVYFFSDFVER